MLRLGRARRAGAGLEFAILLPFLLALLCGAVDVSRALIFSRRLTAAATATAMVASTMAVQATNLNALTGTQALQASTAPFATFPDWLSPPLPGPYSVTLSAVTFKQAGASYAGQVAWSVGNPNGRTRLRGCGALSQAPDEAAPSLLSLPADAFSPTSLLVADVSGVFVPTFTSVFVGPITLQRSAYVSPRINNGVSLQGRFAGPSVVCAAT